MPWIFASVGFGYEPPRSPPAVPDGWPVVFPVPPEVSARGVERVAAPLRIVTPVPALLTTVVPGLLPVGYWQPIIVTSPQPLKLA